MIPLSITSSRYVYYRIEMKVGKDWLATCDWVRESSDNKALEVFRNKTNDCGHFRLVKTHRGTITVIEELSWKL